jgi:hypothetical protein
MQSSKNLYRALIKTHHMTSRRKIDKLIESAARLQCAVLIRTGGVPGVMYVEGEQATVEEWVAGVRVCSFSHW